MGAGAQSTPTTPRSRPNLVIDGYEQHYFSGNQCKVYFDGVYVSDINYIEYSIVSNKAPIYSYNDPYYKLVARGNYLVQGNFNINLTERNRLIKIKNQLEARKAKIQSTEFDLRALRTDTDILKYFSAATDFDQSELISKYMDAYWNTNTDGPINYLRLDEWDLDRNMDIYPDGFNIVMVFGVPGGPQNRYTVKQINNVHVTGESMVIQEGGQPMVEQYTFFARKIDGEKSTYYPHEDKLGPPEDMRVDIARDGYPIRVTTRGMYEGVLPGAEYRSSWTAEFEFNTNSEFIHISSIDVGKIVYGYYSGPTEYPTRTDIWSNPHQNADSIFKAIIAHMASNRVRYVELRDVIANIVNHDRPDVIYSTNSFSTEMVDNAIISRQSTEGGTLPSKKVN